MVNVLAMFLCTHTLSVGMSPRQQAPLWCCPSVMVSSLLCRGSEKVNFQCVQWAGSEEGPSCCVGWPVDSLVEGEAVVAAL